MIGTILGQRYKIIKPLGTKRIGETYLAEDLDSPLTPKSLCIVKQFQPRATDPNIGNLFEQEAGILHRAICHPSPVRSG